MQTVTLTIDVSDEIATRLYALPKETINHFATAAVPEWLQAAEEASEPVDEAFVTELIAADEETKRVGTIPLEEVIRQFQSESGIEAIERARARLAAEGLTAAQVIGAPTGSVA